MVQQTEGRRQFLIILKSHCRVYEKKLVDLMLDEEMHASVWPDAQASAPAVAQAGAQTGAQIVAQVGAQASSPADLKTSAPSAKTWPRQSPCSTERGQVYAREDAMELEYEMPAGASGGSSSPGSNLTLRLTNYLRRF